MTTCSITSTIGLLCMFLGVAGITLWASMDLRCYGFPPRWTKVVGLLAAGVLLLGPIAAIILIGC